MIQKLKLKKKTFLFSEEIFDYFIIVNSYSYFFQIRSGAAVAQEGERVVLVQDTEPQIAPHGCQHPAW